jgi:hypothetical protein
MRDELHSPASNALMRVKDRQLHLRPKSSLDPFCVCGEK